MVATNQAAQRQQHDGGDRPVMDAVISETERQLREQMMTRPELMQMRMENEAIMTECRLRPRDPETIKAELREQLEAFPELAEKAIYNKPVGKDENNNQTYVEGLSVRAAETLAEAYGANRVRSDVTPLDEHGNKVKVEATFTDFQKCKIWQDGGIVSRFYKGRDGNMRTHSEDRFYNVVVKAEASKRVREVILRSISAGLKAWFFNECKKTLTKLLDDDKIREIITSFRSKGVSLESLEDTIGRPASLGWTIKDKTLLLGLWNAINDGETSVEEAFGKKPNGAPTGKENGSATTAGLTNPKQAEHQANPEPAKEQPETAQQSVQLACGEQEEAHSWLERLKRAIPEAQSPEACDAIVAAARDHGGLLNDDDVTEIANRVERRKATIEKARASGSLTA